MLLWRLLSAVVFMVLLLVPVPGFAEISVGIGGGATVPLVQDLTLKIFDSTGQLIERKDQDTFHPGVGPILGLTVSYWGDKSWLGVELSLLNWKVEGKAKHLGPEKMDIQEGRTGIFLSILGRYPSDPTRTYLYGGIGIGSIAASVSGGGDTRRNNRVNFGGELIGGIAVPLTPSMRLRLETRILLAHDVDASNPGTGSYVETSGAPVGLKSPHLDTMFFSPMLVLEYWFLSK